MTDCLSRFRLSLLAAALASTLLGACGKNPDTLVVSGQEYLAKGDDKAAIIQFKNALIEAPNNGQARLLLGSSLLATGDIVGAEKELRRALELGQAADKVVPLLAQAMITRGQGEAVIKEFGQLKLESPEAEASLKAQLGDVYLAANRRDEARVAYDAARQAQLNNPRARLGQARLLAFDKNLVAATAIVEQVMVDAPNLAEASLLLADLRVAQGEKAAASKVIEEDIARNPKFIPTRLIQISDLLAAGDLEKAGRQVEAARAIAPNDVRVMYLEALVAYRKGNKALANERLTVVLKNMPNFVPGLMLSGLIALESNNTTMAETYLQAAVARAPGNLEARRLLATSYLRTGQTAKAKEILQPMVVDKANPDPALLLLAGEAALAAGDASGAARFFKTASVTTGVGDDSRRAAAMTRLGQIELQSGNVDAGLKELQTAAALDPNQIQAELVMIANHLSKQDYDKALSAARQLEKRRPDNPMSYHVVGTVLLAKKDRAGARASFEQALKLSPTYLQAATMLAQLDLADKNPAAARARYEAMIEKDPKQEGVYIALADLISRSGGTPDEVVKVLQQAVTANPTAVSARVVLANLYLGRKDTKAAAAMARDAAAVAPNNPQVLSVLAATHEATGDKNQAIETLNKLVQVAPNPDAAMAQLAGAYARMGQPDKSIELLRKLQTAHPNDESVASELVSQLVQAGKLDEAVSEGRKVQRARPNSPQGYVLEGDVLQALGKYPDSEAAYTKGLKVLPTNSVLALKLHGVLLRAGKKGEADALASRWLKAAPKDAVMRMYLAEISMGARDMKAAQAQYKAVLEIDPDNVMALNNLAWVGGELGDPQAMAYAERAFKLSPKSPPVVDTLGVLLIKKGEVAKGLDYQDQAVQLAPNVIGLRVSYARSLIKADKKDLARKQLEVAQTLPGDASSKKEAAELLKTL